MILNLKLKLVGDIQKVVQLYEILKVIEEKLFSIGLGNNILDMKPKAQATKAKLKAPVQSRKHLRVKKAV